MPAANAQPGFLASPLGAVTVAIGFALMLVLMKAFAFVQTGSVAMLSSLVDSLLDSLASAINLLAIRYALAPADKEHRFGHGKAEPLAALAQAAFITGSGGFVLLEALRRIQSDAEPIPHAGVGVVVLLVGIVGTGLLVLYQRQVAAKSGSLVIEADSLHYLSDLLAHVVVLLALLLGSQHRWWWVDSVAAVLVAAYVLHSAWSVGRNALNQLMDRELNDDMRGQIVDLAKAQSGVLGVHDLKTRAAGPNRFIQLHLELDGGLSLHEAHEIAERVEAQLLELCPGSDVIIHQDPINCAPAP